jgi:hypothetical protein
VPTIEGILSLGENMLAIS